MDANISPSTTPMPSVRINALGSLEVYIAGGATPFANARVRKPLELLLGLIAAGLQGAPQHRICEALWPESEGDAAYRALITTVYRLRRSLQCFEAVQFSNGRVSLSATHCWVDAWAFEPAVTLTRGPHDLLQALRLYRGPLLADFETPLVFEARDRLQRKFVGAALLAARQLESSGSRSQAIDLYERAIDADAGCEELHRELMRLLAKDDQASAVAHAYQRCRAALLRRFGTLPSPATERIWRESAASRTTTHTAGYAAAAYAAST